MMVFQLMIAAIATGLCTKFFGWPGFLGSLVGQLIFAVFFL